MESRLMINSVALSYPLRVLMSPNLNDLDEKAAPRSPLNHPIQKTHLLVVKKHLPENNIRWNFDIYYDHIKNAEKDDILIQPKYSSEKNLIDEFKRDRFQVKTYVASPPRQKKNTKKGFLTPEEKRDLDEVFYMD